MTEESETILQDALVVVTGARNSGKTFFAITALPPSQVDKVFYHDSERSANRTIQELEAQDLSPGYYCNLEDRFDLPSSDDLLSRISKGSLPWVTPSQRSTMEEYYKFIIRDLDENLKQDKYLVYVHDTIEKLEAGMAAWVESHKKQTGWTSKAYGKLWIEGVYPLYTQLLEAIFQRGVKMIIFASHLKTPWQGNHPVVGKVVPSGKRILYFRTSLYLWLVQNPLNADGAPAGLIMKERLGSLRATKDDKWKARRMLPRRLPHCTWEDILKYLEEGCDLANPALGEKLSPDEEGMIQEWKLSNAQIQLMVLEAETKLEEMKQQVTILAPSPVIEAAVESNSDVLKLSAAGKKPKEIAKEVGISLPMVLRMLREQ